jgi:hypothetical protein
MGRYYNGDIEGKFWFGVQSSTAPERFGCSEIEKNSIDYYIDSDSKDEIFEELSIIKKKLGDNLQKFDDFFGVDGRSYNDEMLLEAGLDPALLEDYADYGLGMKIFKCVEEQGFCEFTAEC